LIFFINQQKVWESFSGPNKTSLQIQLQIQLQIWS
jgi:hypothetical protein